MLGSNVGSWSGNVAGDPFFSRTNSGEVACSFKIVIDGRSKSTVFVRINAYGERAETCENRKLQSGDYVIVVGELMNRRGKGSNEIIVEIRGLLIVIVDSLNKR